MAIDLERHALACSILKHWLHASSLHGCSFAAWAAGKDRIELGAFFDEPSADVAAQFGDLIEAAARNNRFALGVFPDIATPTQVVDLVEHLLNDGDRWAWTAAELEDRFAVNLLWCVEERRCSALGFAPLLSMPIFRRAPFVRLGVWPGGYENPRRKKRDAFVGVGDMAHDIEDAKYDVLFDDTRKRVGSVRSNLSEDSAVRGLTFAVPEDLARPLPRRIRLRPPSGRASLGALARALVVFHPAAPDAAPPAANTVTLETLPPHSLTPTVGSSVTA